MNKIINLLFFFLASINIYAAVQLEALGLFCGRGDDRQQWIELKNRSGSIVDISGFSLQLEEEVLYKFPAGTSLQPHGKIRVTFFSSPQEKGPANALYAARETRFLTGKLYLPEGTHEFTRLYEKYRVFQDEAERKALYARLLPTLNRIPVTLERLYVKNADSEIEDAVLISDLFINKKTDIASPT